jgi:hypothetical protein
MMYEMMFSLKNPVTAIFNGARVKLVCKKLRIKSGPKKMTNLSTPSGLFNTIRTPLQEVP